MTPYNRKSYDYNPEVQRQLLPHYLPYEDRVPDPGEHCQVEHIVSLEEAHVCGAWKWPREKRGRFARDTLNQCLATPAVNRAKSDKDVSKWLPPDHRNRKWFAHIIYYVKLKWGLEMDDEERLALRRILHAR